MMFSNRALLVSLSPFSLSCSSQLDSPNHRFSLIRLDDPRTILFQCAHQSLRRVGNQVFTSPRMTRKNNNRIPIA
jgi:hypothetical protein